MSLECRRRLADLVEPVQLLRGLVSNRGAIGKAFLKRLIDLTRDREFGGGRGRCGKSFGEAGGELFLISLTEPLHQLLVPLQRGLVLAGLCPSHGDDDLRRALTGPSGSSAR